ncbi:MAG: AmmeMemoRadiSam system protein A [Spirochaetales bacterium]|nr:AmmeMemoRadiSam system protein A [Spirochaetales bacterium]MBP7262542.1 AmmeMemoRadiSam system protein A [Spirochaetia bacterium]
MLDLGSEDRAGLLATAREAIRARLGHRKPAWPALSPAAAQPCGAFVTLHKHGNLRGCIGRMVSSEPLYQVVRDMAVAAAFDDPRFPPLDASEEPELDLEISALSPMESCKPDDVQPGVHGVHLSLGWNSGVFLPQVAPEQGWDRDQLLHHLCLKAGLPPGSHRDPGAELKRFTAVVFGERD